MDFLKDYRNASLTRDLVAKIKHNITRPWKIMEICGGQTHAIMQYGIDQLLPPEIELIHGPGCPVCVTSLESIDRALAIAQQPNVIFTSFGDMLRVPGSNQDLFAIRARGGDVRVVYSPLAAVKIAQENPDKQVVFFAIGFETTVPVIAMSILQAQKMGINNYSIIPANVLVPPAMQAILGNPKNQIQAFLGAGHVSAVMGYWEYERIAEQYKTPIVVTGFEPLDLVNGIFMAILQLEAGEYKVQNAYPRIVSREGNTNAQAIIKRVFTPIDRKWRGIGIIPRSGLGLRPEYESFDATKQFEVEELNVIESPLCIAGIILQGLAKPIDCPAFGLQCTPQTPLGAPMVSSEGACSAYFRYSRIKL
ncbi:MAG: hydrogenase formation protein HypD [Anaerolineaceae bacterium]|nr:hydrogenase formation protein HypD [Anaerolineaceae bacterium]